MIPVNCECPVCDKKFKADFTDGAITITRLMSNEYLDIINGIVYLICPECFSKRNGYLSDFYTSSVIVINKECTEDE